MGRFTVNGEILNPAAVKVEIFFANSERFDAGSVKRAVASEAFE
jgi:hypothetical protein